MKKPETSKATEKENLQIDSFSIDRTFIFKNGDVTFDMTLNGIRIYGCRIIEGKNGDFVAFPERKGNDGKYYSIVWARLSEKDNADIVAEVEKKVNEK